MSVKRTDENEMQLCEVKKNCKKPGAAFFSELWCLGDLQGTNWGWCPRCLVPQVLLENQVHEGSRWHAPHRPESSTMLRHESQKRLTGCHGPLKADCGCEAPRSPALITDTTIETKHSLKDSKWPCQAWKGNGFPFLLVFGFPKSEGTALKVARESPSTTDAAPMSHLIAALGLRISENGRKTLRVWTPESCSVRSNPVQQSDKIAGDYLKWLNLLGVAAGRRCGCRMSPEEHRRQISQIGLTNSFAKGRSLQARWNSMRSTGPGSPKGPPLLGTFAATSCPYPWLSWRWSDKQLSTKARKLNGKLDILGAQLFQHVSGVISKCLPVMPCSIVFLLHVSHSQRPREHTLWAGTQICQHTASNMLKSGTFKQNDPVVLLCG